jgi:hypothetical protein
LKTKVLESAVWFCVERRRHVQPKRLCSAVSHRCPCDFLPNGYMFVDICRVFMCVRCSMALVEPHVAVIIKRALRYFRCQSNIYRRLNGRSFPQRAARKLKFECSAAACVIEYVPRTRVYCPPSRRQRCARPVVVAH